MKKKVTIATTKGARGNNQDSVEALGFIPDYDRSSEAVFQYQRIVEEANGELEEYSVFDGIGGGAQGDLASATAAESVRGFIRSNKKRFNEELNGSDVSNYDQKAIIQDLFEEIFHETESNVQDLFTEEERGGTTATIAVLLKDQVWFANKGDSPGLLFSAKDKEIRSLYTSDRMEGNYLANYVGGQLFSAFHSYHAFVEVGDRILLSSDGLSEKAARKVLKGKRTLYEVVSKAGKKRASDNVTAILIEFIE